MSLILTPRVARKAKAAPKVKIASKEKEYFAILGVEPGSDIETVKKAYRRLILEQHPDKNKNSRQSTISFRKIKEAWETLRHGALMIRPNHHKLSAPLILADPPLPLTESDKARYLFDAAADFYEAEERFYLTQTSPKSTNHVLTLKARAAYNSFYSIFKHTMLRRAGRYGGQPHIDFIRSAFDALWTQKLARDKSVARRFYRYTLTTSPRANLEYYTARVRAIYADTNTETNDPTAQKQQHKHLALFRRYIHESSAEFKAAEKKWMRTYHAHRSASSHAPEKFFLYEAEDERAARRAIARQKRQHCRARRHARLVLARQGDKRSPECDHHVWFARVHPSTTMHCDLDGRGMDWRSGVWRCPGCDLVVCTSCRDLVKMTAREGRKEKKQVGVVDSVGGSFTSEVRGGLEGLCLGEQ
ncbi:hypothetical protein QBC47DRAFT_400430 [Echria macrotheca]|uniref:J domain-containing protein n=1 Tax=Echria macrotheca TaxID=438768 RepID=A0AAJ0FCR3_9PEZI|nr:hypothetical protein QBC47DRAFT_400430 [Echria macrotheca]